MIADRLQVLPAADLRRQFDVLQLTVAYHEKKEADIVIVLHSGGLDRAQVKSRAPGEIRTHTVGGLSALSLPGWSTGACLATYVSTRGLGLGMAIRTEELEVLQPIIVLAPLHIFQLRGSAGGSASSNGRGVAL